MENLGKVFRDFRLNGHYSLKEAAGQVCSTSQLSRFELDESDMTLSKFLDLLDNIHVTLKILWTRHGISSSMSTWP